MMTIRIAAAATLAAAALACSDLGTKESRPTVPIAAADDARMQWWREARFGLFIHWGLYAVPAGEWNGATGHGEWIRDSARIPVGEYEKFRAQWNPVKFDADAWARAAKQAGMRYVVITTKHHDGFCNFDSACTDWDVMSTPFRRDVMKELSEACRREGLKICWYHSIMDWHHPDYLPRRGWEEANRSAAGADFARYRKYLHDEVTELLKKYGEIGVMWFDGEWENTWTHEFGAELYQLCRKLQPNVIVNNRVDVGRSGMQGMTHGAGFVGDFGTPEQEIPPTGLPGVDWETCMTMNEHWGYNSHDQNWKSSEDLIRKLADIASKGGNFLLNVGPRADGTIPEASLERLAAIGRWMEVNGDSIHGTTTSPFAELPFGRCTVKSERRADGTTRSRLFLHVFDAPADGKLVLPGLGSTPRRACLLAQPDAELAFERRDTDVVISLPSKLPDPIDTVVALDLEGTPIVYRAPKIEAVADEFVRALDVTLTASAPELAIRCTLDGSEPTANSPRCDEALRLQRTTRVRARAFHDDRPVSPIVERTFTRAKPKPALTANAVAKTAGLVRERFQGRFERLPDLATLDVAASDVAPAVVLQEASHAEYVALRFTGQLQVSADDEYLFALASDDGSKLWIDDDLVIDNDGLHGVETKEGAIALAAGSHCLRVEWFNASGGANLDLQWAPLGGALAPIPAGALHH